MCKTLRVSRSGYYGWQRRPVSERRKETERLMKRIGEIFHAHKKRYGSPRIYQALKKEGFSCSENRVARLMRVMGLRAEGKKPFRVTTNSRHNHRVAPNLLARSFTAEKPNQVWTGDITYVRTVEGWLYLAVVIDLFSRKIVGWSMSKSLGAKLALDALAMAVKQRRPGQRLIFHSDRGVQYASHLFRAATALFHITQSMSRKGDCWDNAPTESFFATLKKELIRGALYNTGEQARLEIFRFIEAYYNGVRLHSSIQYCSPREFEEQWNGTAA